VTLQTYVTSTLTTNYDFMTYLISLQMLENNVLRNNICYVDLRGSSKQACRMPRNEEIRDLLRLLTISALVRNVVLQRHIVYETMFYYGFRLHISWYRYTTNCVDGNYSKTQYCHGRWAVWGIGAYIGHFCLPKLPECIMSIVRKEIWTLFNK
jgi:hypothetical protein